MRKRKWGWLPGTCVVAFIVGLMLFGMLFGGCNRGDFKATPVIEGQAAPHDGFNIGPDIWVTAGQPVKINGMVIWIKSVDPNSLMGSELTP